MMRALWAMPEITQHSTRKQWFVFIDTDTFVDWDNLFGLLEHLNAEDRLYIGSPVWLPGLEFAHGGSAYAVSDGAMAALNGADSQTVEGQRYSQYGLRTTDLCCGDEAIARVLKSKGVSLKGYWPMFNGETPNTVSFGSEIWCSPVISLHHLGGDDMQILWQWIREWKTKTRSEVSLMDLPTMSIYCLLK